MVRKILAIAATGALTLGTLALVATPAEANWGTVYISKTGCEGWWANNVYSSWDGKRHAYTQVDNYLCGKTVQVKLRYFAAGGYYVSNPVTGYDGSVEITTSYWQLGSYHRWLNDSSVWYYRTQ